MNERQGIWLRRVIEGIGRTIFSAIATSATTLIVFILLAVGLLGCMALAVSKISEPAPEEGTWPMPQRSHVEKVIISV